VHDLCPVWVANPSLSGTFIRKLTRRFIPAHKENQHAKISPNIQDIAPN